MLAPELAVKRALPAVMQGQKQSICVTAITLGSEIGTMVATHVINVKQTFITTAQGRVQGVWQPLWLGLNHVC